VALYSDLEVPVGEAVREIELPPHGSCEHDVEDLLGHFVDVSWAYRFGPPAQDLVVLSLERAGENGIDLLSQCFRFPAGRPLGRETAARLGIAAKLSASSEDLAVLTLNARRFAYGVRVHVPGFRATDDAFSLEPGGERRIELVRSADGASADGGTLTALNLLGRVAVARGDTG
jgi:beta-mannosidase